jgi:hypothetical protein
MCVHFRAVRRAASRSFRSRCMLTLLAADNPATNRGRVGPAGNSRHARPPSAERLSMRVAHRLGCMDSRPTASRVEGKGTTARGRTVTIRSRRHRGRALAAAILDAGAGRHLVRSPGRAQHDAHQRRGQSHARCIAWDVNPGISGEAAHDPGEVDCLVDTASRQLKEAHHPAQRISLAASPARALPQVRPRRARHIRSRRCRRRRLNIGLDRCRRASAQPGGTGLAGAPAATRAADALRETVRANDARRFRNCASEIVRADARARGPARETRPLR